MSTGVSSLPAAVHFTILAIKAALTVFKRLPVKPR